jgi:hypothetical protein
MLQRAAKGTVRRQHYRPSRYVGAGRTGMLPKPRELPSLVLVRQERHTGIPETRCGRLRRLGTFPDDVAESGALAVYQAAL